MNIDLLSAFAIGLLGAGHCLTMCGGVSGMLLSALPNQERIRKWPLILSYHAGRILSYSLIGAAVGFTGSLAAKSIGVPLNAMRLISGIFLILLGLYLGQWLFILAKIENAGKFVWQHISPLAKKCLPVDSPTKALSLGLVWGWLPCGLVYSTLTWSVASGSGSQGALIMAAFGLGTLPAMISLSVGVFSVQSLLKSKYFRKTTAILMIVYGMYTVQVAYQAMI
ncbi:sulfite exporter TauE/SafE family protein [Thalassotalea sp. M1531]|uniref:Sulfite exporter TauE/SafE family protein n=1 Tax=Thalassotalea algicola TaxID=2716224 RepID=A0A7Y0LBG3_9GAMM|nr:sulfite exporter TauE/SafE family protein [Thalassotalea algicola]NMP31468.1 sulfite exporter TauE/SafE family protein [Thalassotalea algicola]